jgi:hypothetical protein
VEVLHGQAGSGKQQLRLQPADHVLQRFLRKPVRYMKAGMRVANLISFS